MRRFIWVLLAAFALTSCRHLLPELRRAGPSERLQFFAEANEPGATHWVLPQSGVRVDAADRPVITGADVVRVEATQLELGRGVRFQFKPEGVRTLARISKEPVRRRIVLVVDHEAVGTFPASELQPDGSVSMFVEIPDADIPAWTSRLQAALQPVFRFPFSE